MTVVTVREARTNLSRLIAEALEGGEVVIARGKVPAVRLVPVDRLRRGTPGALRGFVRTDDAAFAPLRDEELRDWGLE